MNALPSRIRELIGRTVGPGEPLTVFANDIERFCRAIGDDNPVFFDPEASASVYGGKPMPLAFPLTRFTSGDERDFTVPLDEPGRLRGEDEIIVLRPVVAGDTLRARTRLVDAERKHGRSGPMWVLRFETEYLLDDDVAMIVRTAILRR